MSIVTKKDIRKGFERLRLIGKNVVIHSSLRSFGYVKGSADAVLDVIQHCFHAVVMPAFCYKYTVAPPENDRPKQNGCNYLRLETWTKPAIPFIPSKATIDPKMGIISCKFALLPGTKRSVHPWNSWMANGPLSKYLVSEHLWDKPNLPLEKLSDLCGQLVLIGVGLSSCSAVHVAEERAGRRSLIRWLMDADGAIKRMKVAGCAKGFDRLFPYCSGIFSETYIGDSKVLTAPLKLFIDHITALIEQYPEITRCSPTCLRCRDAILGGPTY